MKTARLVALALAAGTAAATMTGSPALAAPAKIHYIGSCQASGDYPICTISARTAYDVRHIWIRVRGTITIPGGGGAGRIEASTDNLCDKGAGSGDDSNDFKAFPAYTRRLSQAYASPSACYADALISPVNDAGHGALSAYMYYTRRDGR